MAAEAGRVPLYPGAALAISEMTPIPTLWWLRPVSVAARVGEHRAVVWNRLYFTAGFGQTLGGGGAARATERGGCAESDVVDHDQQHVRGPGRRAKRFRAGVRGILIGVVHGGRDVRRLGNDRNGMAIHQQAPWRVQNRAD